MPISVNWILTTTEGTRKSGFPRAVCCLRQLIVLVCWRRVLPLTSASLQFTTHHIALVSVSVCAHRPIVSGVLESVTGYRQRGKSPVVASPSVVMPRVNGTSSDQASTSDCTGCRKQSGTLQCIECIRDGSGSAVFCANGCFKTHWQSHRKGLLRQSSRYGLPVVC